MSFSEPENPDIQKIKKFCAFWDPENTKNTEFLPFRDQKKPQKTLKPKSFDLFGTKKNKKLKTH